MNNAKTSETIGRVLDVWEMGTKGRKQENQKKAEKERGNSELTHVQKFVFKISGSMFCVVLMSNSYGSETLLFSLAEFRIEWSTCATLDTTMRLGYQTLYNHFANNESMFSDLHLSSSQINFDNVNT